jgi:hypothetical protein
MLAHLTGLVEAESEALRRLIGEFCRDYIIGFDVWFNRKNVGQFAAVLLQDAAPVIVWKSLPFNDEDRYLAGFGTPLGRESPRFVRCSLGKAAVLVCHDAKAFNPRPRRSPIKPESDRGRVVASMNQMMTDSRPDWVLNLVHEIDYPGKLGTLEADYEQVYSNYGRPVVGSFGYAGRIKDLLIRLAGRARVPRERGLLVVLRRSQE